MLGDVEWWRTGRDQGSRRVQVHGRERARAQGVEDSGAVELVAKLVAHVVGHEDAGDLCAIEHRHEVERGGVR